LELAFVAQQQSVVVTLCLPFFRLRNDLYCVEWGVILYSLTHARSTAQGVRLRGTTRTGHSVRFKLLAQNTCAAWTWYRDRPNVARCSYCRQTVCLELSFAAMLNQRNATNERVEVIAQRVRVSIVQPVHACSVFVSLLSHNKSLKMISSARLRCCFVETLSAVDLNCPQNETKLKQKQFQNSFKTVLKLFCFISLFAQFCVV